MPYKLSRGSVPPAAAASRRWLCVGALLATLGCTPTSPPNAPPTTPPAPAQPVPSQKNPAERREALIARLPDLLHQTGIPGVAIAQVSGGQLVWAGGFGTTAPASDQAVDEHTVFAAASLTKPVVAYAAMRLVDRGVLDLDRPLTSYVALPDLADDPRAGQITARMVLSHSSGLPNWRPGRWTDAPGKLATEFEPGARYQYSGEGFMALQAVLEHLTGQRLDTLVDELVFAPLQMTASSLVWHERFAPNHAGPHRDNGTSYGDRRPTEPIAAGSLMTTATDYGRFLVAFLAGSGLETTTRRAMVQPVSQVGPGVWWGLGWGLEDSPSGGHAIWQWGHDPGYRAFVMADLDSANGLVFLSNSDAGMLLLRDLVDATLGHPKRPVLAHLPYESHDAPARRAAIELERTLRDDGIEAARALYTELRRQDPNGRPFQEQRLNRLGYELLGEADTDAAVAILELNAATFPESWNTHDSLGEAYMARGDKAAAIASYQRSLELNPDNHHAVEQLKHLRSGS